MAVVPSSLPVDNTDHSHHDHSSSIPLVLKNSRGNATVFNYEDDVASHLPSRGSKKRKVADLTKDDPYQYPAQKTKKPKRKGEGSLQTEQEEKRLKRFRSYAPTSYQAVFERATSQRMFVLERQHTGTAEVPEETVNIAGTTGNIYTVVIGRVPSCDCPHAQKGNQCKHIIYVLSRTLKAPPHLQYQLAFLTSELLEIFSKAPPLPSENAGDNGGRRKPVEDECPICCVDFDDEHDEIVWCKAACGNNLHKACFEQWAAQKKVAGGGVTCPFCRSRWEGDQDVINKVSKLSGKKSSEGYVNVADQLGLSGMRGMYSRTKQSNILRCLADFMTDYSSYHRPWVNRQRRAGRLNDEDYYGE